MYACFEKTSVLSNELVKFNIFNDENNDNDYSDQDENNLATFMVKIVVDYGYKKQINT